MPAFNTVIRKFAAKGEKTGWTIIDVPPDIILKLKLKNKKEFRIKGHIDNVKVERLVCYPTGGGEYIIAINAELRKKLCKKEGNPVAVNFTVDHSAPLTSKELLDCLKNEPEAEKQFNTLLTSHKNYFHRYVYSAKGESTRAGRILNVINAMYKKQNFPEMIRSLKSEKA